MPFLDVCSWGMKEPQPPLPLPSCLHTPSDSTLHRPRLHHWPVTSEPFTLPASAPYRGRTWPNDSCSVPWLGSSLLFPNCTTEMLPLQNRRSRKVKTEPLSWDGIGFSLLTPAIAIVTIPLLLSTVTTQTGMYFIINKK